VWVPSITRLVFALVLASVGFHHPASAEGGSAEPDVKSQLLDVWNRDLFTGDWAGQNSFNTLS
jgi:hypothetical protein